MERPPAGQDQRCSRLLALETDRVHRSPRELAHDADGLRLRVDVLPPERQQFIQPCPGVQRQLEPQPIPQPVGRLSKPDQVLVRPGENVLGALLRRDHHVIGRVRHVRPPKQRGHGGQILLHRGGCVA